MLRRKNTWHVEECAHLNEPSHKNRPCWQIRKDPNLTWVTEISVHCKQNGNNQQTDPCRWPLFQLPLNELFASVLPYRYSCSASVKFCSHIPDPRVHTPLQALFLCCTSNMENSWGYFFTTFMSEMVTCRNEATGMIFRPS